MASTTDKERDAASPTGVDELAMDTNSPPEIDATPAVPESVVNAEVNEIVEEGAAGEQAEEEVATVTGEVVEPSTHQPEQ